MRTSTVVPAVDLSSDVEQMSRPSRRPPALETVVALLEGLLTEVRGLRADLSRRGDRLTRSDLERLGRILPAIGGVFGSELFATRELFASAAPAVRIALDDETPKGLGRLFHRAVGTAIGRYTIRAEGRELGATLWRVMQVDGFSKL